MDKILKIVEKPSKQIATYAFLTAALFSLLVNASGFTANFMPVIGNLFILIIELAVWACIPALILMKKEELAKKFFLPILFYWFLVTLLNFFVNAGWAVPNVNPVRVAFAVFEFILALTLIAGVVLYVLAKVKKNAFFEKLAFVVFGGSFVFFLVVFSLNVAIVANWGAVWSDYFDIILSTIVLPVAFFFAGLYFYKPEVGEVAAAEPTIVESSEKEEPVAEPAAEEAKVEAAATEEPEATTEAPVEKTEE